MMPSSAPIHNDRNPEMDIGGTKMEAPRPFLQESPAQPAASTCGNLSLESARPVALETTPNPLTYWPPPASTSPMRNSSKETADALRNQTPNADPSQPNYPTERDSILGNYGETRAVTKFQPNNSHESGLPSTNPPRILHHNLPPIAGITSSHNYRCVREFQKNPQVGAVEGVKPEKTAPVEDALMADSERKTDSEKEKQDENADCEIVEVLTAPSTERPKTANSYYVFSIPAAINSNKPLAASRAPTPFVPCPSPATDPLVLNINCPIPPAGSPSPSPSSRTASSPHLAPLSPTLQSRSPSESPRVTPSNLPSPKLHRALSSSHVKLPSPVDSSRMLNSPFSISHLQNNPPSPSSRTVGSPSCRVASSPNFVAHSPTLQSRSPSESPRVTPSNLPSPKLHRALSSSHVKMPSPADGSRMLNSPHSMGHPQNNPPSPSQRIGLSSYVPNSHSNPAYLNTSIPNYNNAPTVHSFNSDPNRLLPSQDSVLKQPPPQRINQSADNQVCRNPFELPMAKPYAYQSENEIVHHGGNVRSVDPHQSINQFVNMPGEHHRTLFYSAGFKHQPAKDGEIPSDEKYKPMNSVSKGMYPSVGDQNRKDFLHRDLPKQPELLGNKINGPGVVPWAKPEQSEATNANKNFNKVNGNEFLNRKAPEVGYQNAMKHPSECFAGRISEKQNGNLNSLSQRFPPVPQSNYDLNRHIYDSMTGGRTMQPQIVRPSSKPSVNSQPCKNQPFYRDVSNQQEQDKTQNYVHTVPVKLNNFSEKPVHEAYQNKRPMSAQSFANPAFPQLNDTRHPFAGPDLHRPSNQGFASKINTTHNVLQSPCPTLSLDKNRPTLPQKHVECDAKKLSDAKPNEVSQFPSPQPQISVAQGKPRTPSATAVPGRSRRESPLDLSVKTVRQSADSTAKDDGEVYLQNFRNFIQGSGQPHRYSVSHSNEGATGAPKIDFTPNFAGFHTESPASSSHHKPEMSTLPSVESFKKYPARLPTPAVQDSKNKPTFNLSKYFSPTNLTSNQNIQNPPADPTIRYSDNFRGETLKRSLDDPLRTHSSQPKTPKIDPWKLVFDQQIEQRLNSARISHQNSQKAERAVNGMDASKPQPLGSQYPSSYQSHSGNHYRGASMYPRPPIQTSATPYNPSYLQQPQCQSATPQTPQEKPQHRENVGHSPDPEQIIKQISKGVMPDHKLLQDKNVLSILRSSLEEKEAKLMQLREVAKRKEKYKELTSSDSTKKSFQYYEQAAKNQLPGKQTLPPFGALTLERICAPPSFPGHKLNLPRPVDTVKIDIEPTRKYFSPIVKNEGEKNGIPGTELSPHDDAQGPPTDLDGLAAFLAARIRTKGELKQVGPTLDPGRAGFPHQMKNHPVHGPSIVEPYDRGVPLTQTSATTLQPNGSPPKLVRESRLLPPLRRRYFSHTEDETPTTSGTQNEEQRPLPPRDPNGIRSSSETSVFDFRESDSEGEMPVLERQTLEGMRRDRRTIGLKQNVSTTTPDDVIEAEKPEVIAELDKSHPDPFWDTAFDMFVEQLEKRPPKRSFWKKKVANRVPFPGSETEETEKCNENRSDDSADDKKNDSILIQVKKEPEEHQEKIESVLDGHIKLSSSRLKIYRDEMRLKEGNAEEKHDSTNKIEEREEEKEAEKLKLNETKNEETPKRSETGVKTRGKTKTENKEATSFLNFDSDLDERDTKSDSESTAEDDDDSLSLSGLESESTDSETSPPSSNSNYSSSDESDNETVAKKKQRMQTRLQTRSSRQRQLRGTGMKLRSKASPLPKATAKPTKKKKKRKDFYSSGKKKKPPFGDGSDFRPGWEEECYKFKQQLRMPEKLISISRPPKRSSVSLPDLDPYRNSPSLDSSDVSITKKSETAKTGPETDDSDMESTKQKSRALEGSPLSSDNNVPSLLKSRNGKKTRSNSIINMLVDKYGKGNLKKQKELKAMNERKSPRILPKATNKPELLPTPGLGIGKENVLKDKKRPKDSGKKKLEEGDSKYLGYFRRKTVNNFKEAFKQKVGLLPQEFTPVVLKSRTRTQLRDLKKRTTLIEVFGEERPASAPPLTREEDSTDQEKVEKCPEKKKRKVVKKVCGGVVTRGRGKLTRSGRPGLRSTAVLRSNKAVQNSKRHLNAGRKRNMDLLRIRAMASKKFTYLVTSSDTANQLPITKKRLKLKSVRRKFRSGFDYIRKKKKMKKDGDSADGSIKEKRLTTRPTSESVEDIQNEIKNWVINKGLGETLLHRAARLGYTDVAAYCLEKMDCSPSPRDNAGYTPLHEACSRGHLEIAKLLLMYGASVSESAKGGIRPLHEAAENGFTELIRLLLSYGADPLLETYTGHTALSLVTDEEARRLIQHHLADVQGNVAPTWTFQGPASLFDVLESGYEPLCDPPSPGSVHSEFELETSESMLPTLYRLTGDREPDRRWVLLKDVLSFTKAKSKEALLKQLGASACREMKLSEFNEQSKSCNLLGIGDRLPTKASKVVLLPYDDNLRQLLGVEKVVV